MNKTQSSAILYRPFMKVGETETHRYIMIPQHCGDRRTYAQGAMETQRRGPPSARYAGLRHGFR